MTCFAAAFPEIYKKAPLTPKQDEELGTNLYKYGYEKIDLSETEGSIVYSEKFDKKKGKVKEKPWPIPQVPFKKTEKDDDRINTQYDNMLSDHMKLTKERKPDFETVWQKDLAFFFF